MLNALSSFANSHPLSSYLIVVLICGMISYPLRMLVGRVAFAIALRSERVVDDLIVDALRPFRFVFVLPVAAGFYLAYMAHPYTYTAKVVCGLLFIALCVDTAAKLLNGVGAVLRHKAGGTGISYTGIIDVAKLGVVLLGIAVIIAIFFETSPLALLSGIGAFTAVLMLVFKDTVLSIVASLQNTSWGYFREGDWIAAPEFGADGLIESIGLYEVTVRNWDLTTSLIPTHKVLNVTTKNYRSMWDSQARKITRSLDIDIDTIRFCDRPLLERIVNIDSLSEEATQQLELITEEETAQKDNLNLAKRKTNLDLFRLYAEKYLRQHSGVHDKKHLILVRDREPGPEGLPVEVWAFTRNTDLPGYEATQANVFNHLIGVLSLFDLKVFQRKVGGID
jgi:miniconductance mechanosensitive channel